MNTKLISNNDHEINDDINTINGEPTLKSVPGNNVIFIRRFVNFSPEPKWYEFPKEIAHSMAMDTQIITKIIIVMEIDVLLIIISIRFDA